MDLLGVTKKTTNIETTDEDVDLVNSLLDGILNG